VEDDHNNSIDIARLLYRFIRFVLTVVGFYVAYKLLLIQFYSGPNQLPILLGLWLIGSYLVIPKVHKLFSYFYAPNYFVGRAKSPSGMLSDPINLAFFGSRRKIHLAMQAAGWELAEPLSIRSSVKMVYCLALRISYPNAPVGNMYLFRKRQDFAYQQEIKGSPNKRHHIRFWKVPEGWYLPGGHKADWLAAGTFDIALSVRGATGQIDHRIHEDVDRERDYIIKTLKKTDRVKDIEVVKHFTDAYHGRNNGVDRIKTDGSLPFIYL
jgi:hypothetical protein